MILPLACDMITLKKFLLEKKCIMNKEETERKRKRERIKFRMTSIPLRHALLGVTI